MDDFKVKLGARVLVNPLTISEACKVLGISRGRMHELVQMDKVRGILHNGWAFADADAVYGYVPTPKGRSGHSELQPGRMRRLAAPENESKYEELLAKLVAARRAGNKDTAIRLVKQIQALL